MKRTTQVAVALTLLTAGGAAAQHEPSTDEEMPYTFLRAQALWRDGRPTAKGMEMVRDYDRRHPSSRKLEDQFHREWLTEPRAPFLLEALARLEPLEKECGQWTGQAEALGVMQNAAIAGDRARLVSLRLAICNELLEGYRTVIRRTVY